MGKLLKLSDIKPQGRISTDSLKNRDYDSYSGRFDILLAAQEYYDLLRPMREEGERCRKFYFGDAWSDMIETNKGMMREDDYLRMQGRVPLQNNVLRRLGRSILGVYIDSDKEPICVSRDKNEESIVATMNELVKYNFDINRLKSLNIRSFEYFLVYGIVSHRLHYGIKNGKCDIWHERMDINRLFFDTSAQKEDLSDARMVGYIHDLSLDEVLVSFSRSASEYRRLTEVYKYAKDVGYLNRSASRFGHPRLENLDFFIPEDNTKCRVIEIWTKEHKPRFHCHDWLKGEEFKVDEKDIRNVIEENKKRKQQYLDSGFDEADVPLIDYTWYMDDYWYYRFITPTGVVIREGETPYEKGQLPYVFRAYPMLGGTLRSFLADLLDLNKMINRLITKYDWIMSASAKGLVLVPEESISSKMPLEKIASEWNKFNGVIVYKSKGGSPAPHQVSSNATNIGIMELLNLQLKLVEDIASTSGALQGKPGYSGMSASLYAQQTQNSSKGLLDLLTTFDDFVIDNSKLAINMIQQYYDEKKVKEIVGETSVDINAMMDAEIDMTITQSTSSPTYKERANEFLMDLLKNGYITLEQMLEAGKFPFEESLRKAISDRVKDIEDGKTPDMLPQEIITEAQNGANMDAVNTLYNAMKEDSNAQGN